MGDVGTHPALQGPCAKAPARPRGGAAPAEHRAAWPWEAFFLRRASSRPHGGPRQGNAAPTRSLVPALLLRPELSGQPPDAADRPRIQVVPPTPPSPDRGRQPQDAHAAPRPARSSSPQWPGNSKGPHSLGAAGTPRGRASARAQQLPRAPGRSSVITRSPAHRARHGGGAPPCCRRALQVKLGQGTLQTPAPPPRRSRAAPHCGPAPRCHPVLLSPPSCTTVPGFDPGSRPGQDGPATSPLGPPGPGSCQHRAEVHHLSTASTSCICKMGLRDCGRWTRAVVSVHPEHTQQAQARLPVPPPKGQPGFHRDKPTPTSLVTPPVPPAPQSPRTSSG